tara:strand:- start:543 stop:743 length:201 start_codon:yes stop_codon:yes gene_type:complete
MSSINVEETFTSGLNGFKNKTLQQSNNLFFYLDLLAIVITIVTLYQCLYQQTNHTQNSEDHSVKNE